VRASVRAYGLAVRLFPAAFRARFGDELVGTFAEVAADRHRRHGPRGLARLWIQATADLTAHAGGERWAAWRGRESGLPLRDERRRRPRPVIQDVRGGAGMLETLRQDVRFAVRTLVKAPGFTAAVVATIALGVGATTAIFTVVNGIVLRPLPFPGSERAIMICETNPKMGDWCGASPPNLADMARASTTLEAAGVARSEPFIAHLGGESFGVRGGIATPGFFRVLQITPALGRLFEDRDLDRGSNHVAVVSDAFWRQRLGADPGAVGRTITFDGAGFTVIGVLPPNAFIPLFDDTQAWTPLNAWRADNVDDRSWRGFVPLGRIKAGQTLATASTELQALHARLAQAYPEANRDWGLRLVGLRSRLVGPVSRTLWIFLGAVGFVLLIACANVASLLLVRATGRAPEFAVRASLGAGRRRLVRQLLTESLVVSFLGGALGLALAVGATRAFVALAPASIPRLAEVGIDGRVALFAFLLSTATAVFFGLAPARRASRTDLSGTLKGLRQTDAGDARLRAAFVVVQLALALVLLVGAGLLTRSFSRLLQWDPGFERAGVTVSFMLPPGESYGTRDQMLGVLKRAREAAGSAPGVERAALCSGGPLFGGDGLDALLVEGRPPGDPQTRLQVEFYDVDPPFFRTLGIPVVRGRDLTDDDQPGTVPVALVNETLARRAFPGEDPIGHRVTVARHTAEIVGVVGDMRPYRPDEATPPQIYWPITQFPRGAAYLVLRAPVGLEGLEKTVRARVAEIDPDIQLSSFTSLDTRFGRRLVGPRFNMLLVGVFALVAVLLAAIGVYGVVAYSVASRTREIGLRVALGAEPRRIVRQVVRGGLTLAAIGLVIGLAGALAVGRLITSLLYGMPPTDPLTLAGAMGLFVLVVLLASWVPARRAARVDPVIALRVE
jgi:putative ABC transport system permease protein